MKHRYAEMITTKVNDMTLVKLCLSGGKWVVINDLQNIVFNPDLEYFLCHPKHTKACLHWLNGGDVVCNMGKISAARPDVKWYPDTIFMDECSNINIKPDTIMIGNIEIPEPVYEPLEDGEGYYMPHLIIGFVRDVWYASATDCKRALAMGIVHRTKKAAIAHTEALRSFTEVSK